MLTEFDYAVIAYAQERGEDSSAVYKRIDDTNLCPYRERWTEEQLLAVLDTVKKQDAQCHTPSSATASPMAPQNPT